MKLKLLIAANLLIFICINGHVLSQSNNPEVHKVIKDRYDRVIQNEKGAYINYSQQETEDLLNNLKDDGIKYQTFKTGSIANYTKSGGNACDATWKYSIIGGLSERTIAAKDIDNDGFAEIITCMSSYPNNSYWYIMKYDSISRSYKQMWISDMCDYSITSIKTWDLNSDGYPEIIIGYAIGYTTGKIEVYDAQTKELICQATTSDPVQDIEFGDGDNDGTDELVVSTENHLNFYNPANLSLKSQISYGPFDFKIGNVDNDTYNEIALSSGKIIEYKNDSVTVEWTYDNSSSMDYMGLSDIDGDGKKELIKTKSCQYINVYDADIQSLKYQLTTSQDVASLLLYDVNNDGIDEIIYGDGQWGSVFCYNSVTQQKIWRIPNPEWGSFSLCAGDFNNDDSLRIIWSSNIGCSNASRLLVANTVSEKIEWESLAINGPFSAVEIDDIDGDGKLEIAALSISSDNYYESGILSIFDAQTKELKWQCDGTFFGQAWTGMYNLKINDIDNDGNKEIIVAASDCYTGRIWIIDGVNKTIKKDHIYNNENLDSFNSLEVADIDNDSINEIITGESNKLDIINPDDMSLKWRSATLQSSGEYIPIIVADVDGDSEKEIIACSSYLYKIKGISHQQFQSSSSGYSAIALADIDNDGNKEIIAGKTNGTIDIVNPVDFQIKSTINIGNTNKIDGLQVANLNNDSAPEIIFTSNGNVFFYADSNKYKVSKKYSNVAGAYDGLKVRDINADSKKEVILGSSVILFEIPSDCYECMWFSTQINFENVSCGTTNDGSIVVIPSGIYPYTYQWSNGCTDSLNTNLTVGTYIVTVTDNMGCFVIDTVNIQQSQLSANYLSTNETCSPSNDGTASVVITQGTAPFTYQWSTGATSSSITNLSQGSYSVTVSDSKNCILNHTFVIQKDTLYQYFTKTDATCYGLHDGSIQLYPQGTSPYVYSWNTGQSSSYLYNLAAGLYTVTVTDAHGCTSEDSISIYEPTEIQTQVTTTSDNVSTGFGEGSATVNAIGGMPPYSIAWNDPFMQTTVTAINLLAGTYIVTITDNNGCVATDTAIVTTTNNINEAELLSEIKLYPNPTNGILYSKFDFNEVQNLTINIYNVLGKIVHSMKINDIRKMLIPIDISAFESGIYDVNIYNNKFNFNYRIQLIK